MSGVINNGGIDIKLIREECAHAERGTLVSVFLSPISFSDHTVRAPARPANCVADHFALAGVIARWQGLTSSSVFAIADKAMGKF
jgi:hypothetical protein